MKKIEKEFFHALIALVIVGVFVGGDLYFFEKPIKDGLVGR